jgi:ubiquinone/menaquinone biosynthesis C-methylase UbiE
MNSSVDEMKLAEAEFFDRIAQRRIAQGQIPMEADVRRAARFIPASIDEEPIDPKMSNILDGYYRDRFIEYAAHRPQGRILEICCGPGWLALEMGRRNQVVEAYDISPGAIALAKRMLEENPYRDNFGEVTYHLKDVTEEDLGVETLDAVVGWSAFHHLPDLPAFMERVYRSLKPGGIVATMDDLPRGRLEKWLERIFRLLLPTYDRTYRKKAHDAFQRISGKTKEAPEYFTPMEEVAAKDIAVFDIADMFYSKFEVLWDVHFNAFAVNPAMSVIGPDWFRYTLARCIVGLDRLLCKCGLCRGFIRIIVARKPACGICDE